MPFTITDAKTLAESWFDETLDDDTSLLMWGNEFNQRIVDSRLWVEATQEFANSTANTAYDLPTDFVRTVKVEDSNDCEYSAYTIKNGKIKFSSDGSYTLTYTQYPVAIAAIAAVTSGDPPVTVSNAVPLPDAFLYPMAEFLIFKFYNLEMDDDDCKAAASEYEQRMRGSLKRIYDAMEIDSETESFKPILRW